MGNDWKTFIVTTKFVTDLEGLEYTYQIPPSWKSELLIWEILEESPDVDTTSFDSIVNAFDAISKVVTFALKIPRNKNIEDLFDGDGIEKVFTEIWDSITTIPDSIVKSAKSATRQDSKEEFALSSALALFAAECGWTPEQVLSFPKVQVMSLASAISEYVAQGMKFQAAIHGIPLDEGGSSQASSGSSESAQIDIEEQMRQFKSAGFPIEVI